MSILWDITTVLGFSFYMGFYAVMMIEGPRREGKGFIGEAYVWSMAMYTNFRVPMEYFFEMPWKNWRKPRKAKPEESASKRPAEERKAKATAGGAS